MKLLKFILVSLIIQFFTIPPLYAAFCSLRDPVAAIQTLYGQNDNYNYRSLVATVTEKDRNSVKKVLPFTLHNDEVGKHTLYMIYNDDKNVGFLQARSEWAKWGLIEIAWAINIDRTINSFYFQRCRSPECNTRVVNNINGVLNNKTFDELSMFITPDGESLSVEGTEAFVVAPKLALLILRSALKTLAITDITWSNDLLKDAGAQGS